ncbi:MAG: MerR family transcriptional regulator [Chloroflexota bacterium]
MGGQPLYPIGIVAEIIGVHPETLRVWDRQGLVSPSRRRGFRCYSDPDLQRLLFVKYLLEDRGLNLAGVKAYTALYHCWRNDDCAPCHKAKASGRKPCWKRPGAFCGLADEESALCETCAGRAAASVGPPLTARTNFWKTPAS